MLETEERQIFMPPDLEYNNVPIQTPWGWIDNIMDVKGISFIRRYHYKDEPNVVYFDSLVVHPKHRRNGYSWKILSHVIRLSDEEGFKYIKLWTNNPIQRTNFERLGFEYEGDFGEENAIWMIKELY